MKKLYVGQSALRIIIDCSIDLSEASEVSIKAEKPNGIVAVLNAVVLDSENGKICHDVVDDSLLDVSGWWTFCAQVTFSDGRTARGVNEKVFVFE